VPLKPNTKRRGLGLLNAVSIGAALMLVMPIACGDDEDDGGGGKGGRGGSAGRGGSGGKGGGDASAGTGGSSGSGGSAGTAGSGGSAGTAGSGGADGGDGAAGTSGAAGDSGTDGGDGGLAPCPGPSTAGMGKICLYLNPEVITPQIATDLDGQGQLYVFLYRDAAATQFVTPIPIIYPPPTDGGLPPQTDVYDLPMVPIDNIPSDLTTIYIRAIFADNPAWRPQLGLSHGIFVGGVQLAQGLNTPPPLAAVAVTPGAGRNHTMFMTAMRKLTTQVYRYPGIPAPGNGQGPLVVGLFKTDDARGAPAQGGFRATCVNSNNYPLPTSDAAPPAPGYPVTAYFFGSGQFWVGAQIDDYGLGQNPSSGALVSVVLNDAGVERLPPNQRIQVAEGQYSTTLPAIVLTGVVPDAPASDNVSCPVPDGGADGG
jgi:hypothetical protein